MIGRSKGSEKELQTILSRREKAEAEVVQAAAALTAAEHESEERLQEVALSSATADEFTTAKQKAVATLGVAEANAERTRRAFAALSAEADGLAVEVAEQRRDALTASCAAKEIERGEVAAKLAALDATLGHERAELERAHQQIGRAARYTDATRQAAETREKQEAETVEWHAQHSIGKPEQWPLGLEVAIEEAIEARRDLWREEQTRTREASAANLARAGLDPATAAEVLGVGQPFPRKQVR